MSQLIFELSKEGRRCVQLPHDDTPTITLANDVLNNEALNLPEVAEIDLVRHYINLSRKAQGVDNVFYPLGSCTMKYNPKINEEAAALEGFSQLHPLQPLSSVSGALAAMDHLQTALCEVNGMDAFTLQPAAGAHGEFTGMLLIHAYHTHHGNTHKTKVLVPDAAHGTNPASAAMAGYEVVTIPSDAKGCVDMEALKELVDDSIAGLMLTNPNTLGLFEPNIKEIADLVHAFGGLLYYDGANLNAIMGLSRPGDMGFDVVHLNLHKTFSTPHGGGGPGSGPVGVKEHLIPFLPNGTIIKENGNLVFKNDELSIGRMRSFYGNFLVNVRALTYILVLGGDGLVEASKNAVLNANYMMEKLKDVYTVAYPGSCMHEFVLSLEKEKHDFDISAKDISKALLDFDIHPPTMYFPQVVHEALMIEPTETESKETLDHAIEVLLHLYSLIQDDPTKLKTAPHTTPIKRVDDVQAARNPILKYTEPE
jgi:glycine dehydrogenase subunit 2